MVSSLAQHRRLVLLQSYRSRDAVIEGVGRKLEASMGILRTNSLSEATERLERGWSVMVFPDTTHFSREERNICVDVGPLALGFLRGFADLLSRLGVAPMFAARGWRDNAEVNMQEQGETSSCAEEHAAQYGAFLLKILRAAPFQWDRIKYLDLMLIRA